MVWHCVEHAEATTYPPSVTEDTARRVTGFLHGFLLPHALAFYAGVLGLSNDHDRLTAVAGYILAHKLERITNRDVQRGDKSMRNLTRRETEALFEQLDAFGWVTRTPGPRPSSTRRTGSSILPSIRSLPSAERRKPNGGNASGQLSAKC